MPGYEMAAGEGTALLDLGANVKDFTVQYNDDRGEFLLIYSDTDNKLWRMTSADGTSWNEPLEIGQDVLTVMGRVQPG